MLSKALLPFIAAFAIAMVLIPVFIRFYNKFNIVDRRSHRKHHIHDVPTMGGLPLLIAFVGTVVLFVGLPIDLNISVILAGLILMSVLGLYDDLTEIKPSYKLLGQLGLAALVYTFASVQLSSSFGIGGDVLLSPWVALPITILFMAFAANAFNLIDGLDGLASTIGLVIFVFFGVWFLIYGQPIYYIMAFAMSGALLAFLFFNWDPAKIFLGDTGALWIGFCLAILSVQFINQNYALSSAATYKFAGTIGTTMAVLFIPLFDTIRVVFVRLIKGTGIFRADRNHTHHVLMQAGLSQGQVTGLLAFVNLLMIGLAMLMKDVSDQYMVPLVVFIGIQLSLGLEFLMLRMQLTDQGEKSPGFMKVIKSARKVS